MVEVRKKIVTYVTIVSRIGAWFLRHLTLMYSVQDDIDAWPLRHQDTNLFGQHFRLSPISPSFLLSCLIT
jgi:hypothetical protein